MEKDKHKDRDLKKKKKPFAPPRPEEEKKKKIKKRDTTNAPFMQADKGGDILSNFFSNFIRQLKNRTKTGLGRLLKKLLAVKINGKTKKPEHKPEKYPDIMGPVKTVFQFINNPARDNLTPSEKESLRQRTNLPLRIKEDQDKEQDINRPGKNRLRL
ncbi:MAG: hypothetical protein J7574_09660 [Flavobacterium sp.]|uniref:hypothetical protein n=1 Tax=Flavobacterium sp. TaxID=239 RepID=UPI001B0A35CD|nr:hypothetical protein [Flavobacterium sp.]MBO9584411.1 hypothetical protein [Flavobacterium sp.]